MLKKGVFPSYLFSFFEALKIVNFHEPDDSIRELLIPSLQVT